MADPFFDPALFDAGIPPALLFDSIVLLPPEAEFEVGFTLELFSLSGFTEETITEA